MILRRYLTRQVATTTALVVGFLIVMLLGGRLIRYFGIAAEGGLQVGVLFRLIGYNLPYFLELILPLSFFIALMLVFGRLYTDSEMAIINGAGISRSALGRLLTPLVFVLVLIQGYLAFFGKPWGVKNAENIWQSQAVMQVFDLIRPRQFMSSGDFHLYVGEIGENRAYLKDVVIIQTGIHADNMDKQGLWKALPKDSVILASSATQVASGDNQVQLDLHHGRRYELNPISRAYNEVGFERYRISLAANESPIKPLKIEGYRTIDLFNFLQTNQFPHNLTASTVKAELGYRVSLPFLMILATLIALPLSQVKPRQGRWLKLVPSIFVFVAMVLLVISLKNPIAKGKVGVWAYPVLIVCMLVGSVYANYHARLVMRYRLSKAKRGY